MLVKHQLIKQHLAAPAINLGDANNPQIIAGKAGQTHADIMADQPNLPPNVGHGFMTHSGQYLSREQARDYINNQQQSKVLGDMEPDSYDLFNIQPIYQGKSGQRIYHFANNRGASLIYDPHATHDDTDPRYELAAIKLLGTPEQVAAGQVGFTIDYKTLQPKRNLTEDEAHHLLVKLSRGAQSS